jgi:type VI secretion system ImpB/VipA family protein
MDDFSPAAVARKVEGLNKLLEARTQLSNLITYMDGKTGAEELIAKVLKDPGAAVDADSRGEAAGMTKTIGLNPLNRSTFHV